MTLPLNHIRVLDLTNVIAGPLCTLHLAMMGAEVIKIEMPNTGDLTRKLGVDRELSQKLLGTSFLAMNAGKKSLSLNLKTLEGRTIFLDLVQTADVVVENFKPGTMQRLGLDYEVVRARNPSIIYCSISGFGQTGPLSQRPGYDQVIQGFCGLMSLTGNTDTAPQRAGYVVCDAMSAVVAAFAISAALAGRERSHAGEYIDVSMLDASLSTMAAWFISNIRNAGVIPSPFGNENPTSSPSGTYETADGALNIVCNEEKQFKKFCKVIETPELLEDARFNTRSSRLENRGALNALLREKLLKHNTAYWDKAFTEAGVPVGPILPLQEILGHQHVRDRELLKEFPIPNHAGRNITIIRPGFRLSNGGPDVKSMPPTLGEHTDEILAELGVPAADQDTYRNEGVI